MDCTLQLFSPDTWRQCAALTVLHPRVGGDGGRMLFAYDLDYVFGDGAEPVSVSMPVSADSQSVPHLPAFIYDLLPQGAGRKYLLGELGLPDDKSSDFALICAGAFNPIGRLRVKQAVDYFEKHVAKHANISGQNGLTQDQILARDDEFVERMLVHSMLAAGTTGVQGAAPKYLLTIDKQGMWHADGALPDALAAQHFIVKLPRGKALIDKKILRNEAAYMRVAKACGIHTHAAIEHQGDLLFIPRFDRSVMGSSVLRHHQESAASVAGVVGFDVRPTQFDLIQRLRLVLTDREAGTLEFIKRDVLNLAMRNTDNHARNTAIQKIGNVVQLTPLFDFAPMYLDPEGIARTARWYCPDSGKELLNWADVIAALKLAPDENLRLRAALSTFGQVIEGLADCMHQCGVDDDITDFLQKGIEQQARQLMDLTTPPTPLIRRPHG